MSNDNTDIKAGEKQILKFWLLLLFAIFFPFVLQFLDFTILPYSNHVVNFITGAGLKISDFVYVILLYLSPSLAAIYYLPVSKGKKLAIGLLFFILMLLICYLSGLIMACSGGDCL